MVDDPLEDLRGGARFTDRLFERLQERPVWLLPVAVAVVGTAVVSVVVATTLLTPPSPAPETYLPTVEAIELPTESPTSIATTIVVHVAGAVVSPGLVSLASGTRVGEAIEEAGGPLASAHVDQLNLAATLTDGARVYVPVVGETVPPVAALVDGGDEGVASRIDVNQATADELESLPGVGPVIAQAIVDHRSEVGPFATVEDLEQVSGIGPKTIEPLVDLVVVSP